MIHLLFFFIPAFKRKFDIQMIFLMVQGVKTNVKQLIKRVSKIQVSTIDKSVENQEEK